MRFYQDLEMQLLSDILDKEKVFKQEMTMDQILDMTEKKSRKSFMKPERLSNLQKRRGIGKAISITLKQ